MLPKINKEDEKMKTHVKHLGMMMVILAAFFAGVTPAWAATNQATDPGGGSISLTGSGAVTVNSSALQLVKQVWSAATNTCLASSPADATCNSSAILVNVAAGTQLKFIIFVKNNTAFALTDVRFQDVLDTSGTGFTYQAGTMKFDGTLVDTSGSAAIFSQVDGSGTSETDIVDTGGTHYASITGSTILVGAATNQTLIVGANKVFVLEFQVKKN